MTCPTADRLASARVYVREMYALMNQEASPAEVERIAWKVAELFSFLDKPDGRKKPS